MKQLRSLANLLWGPSLLLLCLLSLLQTARVMAATQEPAESQAAGRAPLMLENKAQGDVTTLDMSSGSASVELGPVVVNEDGASKAWIFLGTCGKTQTA